MSKSASADLTPKQARFVEEYLVDLNATQAAIRAGYAKGSAAVEGARLLTNAKVAAVLSERQAELAEKHGVTIDRIITELAKIAFADIRKAVRWGRNPGDQTSKNADPNGLNIYPVSLVPSEEIDDDTAVAVSEVSLTQAGIKIKMHDKKGALVDLGKHLGMFVERSESTVTINDRTTMDAERFTSGIARIAARSGAPSSTKRTVN